MANKFVGQIDGPHKQISVDWKIENYFSLSQKADSVIESPIFHFLNASWRLRVYPNGERRHNSINWVGFYLVNVKSDTETILVNLEVGIRSGDSNSQHYSYVRQLCNYVIRESGYGFPMLVKRNELFKNRHVIAPDGTLTFLVIVKESSDVNSVSSQTVSVDSTRYLSRDFRSLLQSGQKSDVIIKFELKRREFKAHKLILGARSSVFAAMFKYDMKENTSGVVNMEDDCDPDAFQEFLSFMYTGQVQELSAENVFQLITLADKYDVSDLKEICIDFMKDNLTLDIACNVLVVADKQNEDELKKSAKKMIVRNMKTLLPTEQWIIFMRDNANLAAELLMTVIPDNTESCLL